MMNKDAKIICVYGGRGQGKSTYVKALLRQYDRVIVFDPMREYSRQPGFKKAHCLAKVLHYMKEGRRGYRISYSPPAYPSHSKSLHELSVFLMRCQRAYEEEKSSRKICLVVEEMNLSAPSSPLPQDERGFIAAAAQGRHYGIEIIGVTQRPKMVMPTFRSQAAEEIIFKLTDYQDVMEVEKKLPPKTRGKIFALQPHNYLKIAGSDVSFGKNRLSASLS